MTLEDQVEALNDIIFKKRLLNKNELIPYNEGHLVLQRHVVSCNTFGAFKEYNILLWYISQDIKRALVTSKHVGKIVNGNDSELVKQTELKFFSALIDWLLSGELDKVIKRDFEDGIQ